MNELLAPADFKHSIKARIQFKDVDMLGVCNNAVYISFFEEGRIQYLKALGLLPPDGIFTSGDLFFMVRNEINYLAHSQYDDELRIYNRVSFIKNSSYGFDHLIVNEKTKEIIADGKGIVVQVDPATHRSKRLNDNFRNIIRQYEPKVIINE